MKTFLNRIGMTGMIALTMAACSAPSEEARAQGARLCNSTMVKMAEAATMPTLHLVQSKVFSVPYSCRDKNAKVIGSYQTSALFLGDYSKQRNSPELLINGTCDGKLFAEALTAVSDMALIADLGDVPLTEITQSGITGMGWKDNTFQQRQTLTENHTYAVVISKREIRSVFVFRVFSIQGNQVGIHYAVKSYELHEVSNKSAGEDWDKPSQEYKGRF